MEATQFDTSRDWAALARDKKHSSTGQVYIGGGDKVNQLYKIFGGWVNDGDHVNNMSGDTPSIDYFVDIERWEKYTGLNHSETIGNKAIDKTEEKTMKSIHTPYTPTLKALVKEILQNKIVNFEQETDRTAFLFYDIESKMVSDAGPELTEFDAGNSKEVSMAEFISVLTAVPEKPKSVRFSIDSVFTDEEDDGDNYDVILEADKLSIGCHKFTVEEFAQIEAAVQKVIDGIEIPFKNRRTVVVNKFGIEADGERFSFEDFNKIKNALDTLRE